MKDIRFLETALGKQLVILGYPWLVNANPKINWRKREFSWWEEDNSTKSTLSLEHPEVP